MDEDQDDPWLDDEASGATTLQRNADNDWERLSTKFSDAGYREGITAGQQSTVQAGFDQGYGEKGVPLGREVGTLRGVAAGLLVYLGSQSSTAQLTEQQKGEYLEKTRTLVRRLGKFRVLELAGPDREAEQHAREHGEEIVVPQQLRDQHDMDSLEDSLDSLAGRLSGKTNDPQAAEGNNAAQHLAACKQELQLLLQGCGLQLSLS